MPRRRRGTPVKYFSWIMRGLLLFAVLTFFLVCPIFQEFSSRYEHEFCKESQTTVRRVETCPLNISMWRERETIKACHSIPHNCSRELIYHCLINPWQNETIEVCAPATYINAGYCAEYNKGGGRVQDYYKPTCPSCVNNYLSTDAYLHPECYEAVYQVKEIHSPMPTTTRDKPHMVSRGSMWQSRSHPYSFVFLFVLINVFF